MESADTFLDTSVLDLFDHQAQRNPDAFAAVFQGEHITYSQLRHASIQVAILLRFQGVKPRDHVPVLTNMGLDMLVAILGVLRLGACYCPLDFNAWGDSRVLATLDAIGSRLVLSTVDTSLPGYEILAVPPFRSPGSGHLAITPAIIEDLKAIRKDLMASDLIYIIFTSGTTGRPKGVMVGHGSTAHLIQQDYPGAMRVQPGENALLFFSVAFDGCAGVIFATICHGGTLAMAMPGDVIDVAASCTNLSMTPSILSTLEPTPQFDGIREIYLGGEAPTEALIAAWSTPTRKIYNCYGPTECTTAVSTAELTPGGPIILGHLVSGVEIVLLDGDLRHEVEQGEICIRGPCLAIGYLGNETLTREKFFIRDGVRHYRTGDLARRNTNGIHFVGRVDRVVKNRGFLINLEAEVEPALRSCPGVKRAAAFIFQKQLVGVVTPADVSTTELCEHLGSAFDPFIVPDLIFAVHEFSMTTNGKVDLKVLEAMVSARLDVGTQHDESTHFQKTDTMDTVSQAFAKVFNRPITHITPTTSFRSLGGNSLLAVKLMSHLRTHNLKIPMQRIFELDTVGTIGQEIVYSSAEVDSQTDLESSLKSPLTYHQVSQLQETKRHPSSNRLMYSLTRDIKQGGPTPNILRRAWELLLNRHSIYRSTFDEVRGIQAIQPLATFAWSEFTASSTEEFENISKRELQAVWLQSDIELVMKPQFWIIELPGEKIQMNWIVHHVLTDAFSFGILLSELGEIIEGSEHRLPPARSFVGYAQHIARQRVRQRDGIRNFWDTYSQPWGRLRPINVGTPKAPVCKPWKVWTSPASISRSLLGEYGQRHGVSHATVIYFSWALILSEYTGSEVVGTKISVSGRNVDYPCVESVVGPVNGRCPLIAEIKDDETAVKSARSLQEIFFRANEFQWTYPELQNSIPSDSDYWFDSQIHALLDMPVEPGQWDIRDFQKPTAPIELDVIQKGELIEVIIQYDGKRYSEAGVEELGSDFVSSFHAFGEATTTTLVRDVKKAFRSRKNGRV